MEINNFVELISTLGFPIACVIALGIFAWYIVRKIMNDSDEREKRLYEKIGEIQEINKMAIETIANYAQSFGIIEDDISTIKTDITVIKTKLGD